MQELATETNIKYSGRTSLERVNEEVQ